MVFSSNLFLVYFFPAFLIVYFLLGSRLKNPFVLLASIFFYAWGAPDFIFIVLGSIAADYYLVGYMAKRTGPIQKRLIFLSMLLNIGLLGYFKYANFFIENVNALLESFGTSNISWTAIALPIGISFFTFQKITYALDVYRGVYKPLSKITDYALYILMFPQLIAGPIVRYHEIADQILDRRTMENINNRLTGFFRFCIGLAKKVLIANVLGEQVDLIFDTPAEIMNTITVWIGVVAYAFQIYFDFSGYSDMAIGIGRMIGFRFPENFNNPYISQSITEFWRRWHITLGRFMRDYLYIPLGGNRVSAPRLYFNLWVVFLLSGLWHGAAWNFVIWGAFHGLFLIADRLFLISLLKKTGIVSRILFTFFITLVGWVFFRANTLDQAVELLGRMFAFDGMTDGFIFDSKFYFILIVAVGFSFWGGFRKIESWQGRLFEEGKPLKTLFSMVFFSLILFVLSLSSLTASGFNPFIYFRF